MTAKERRSVIKKGLSDQISAMVGRDQSSDDIADAMLNTLAPILAKDLNDVINWIQPLQKGE